MNDIFMNNFKGKANMQAILQLWFIESELALVDTYKGGNNL